ncbi:MAG TPA: Bax inhibitor-1/YccA family protein [Gemmatimonadaceae bacterium]|jgi:modulator of FtsH protease|nr:Bax inhibitor-1/YccA family protein [Gemmatimonadaceae bacterium]
MGISYAPAIQVRSGAERATLVRRTYGLVFLGILATIGGTAFTLAQPALFGAVIAHPFITMIAAFIPLIMVQRSAREYPKNLILTLLFTFVMGVAIAPGMYLAERAVPGVVTQAGLLTFAAFGALSLYAVFSRRDFSAWGAFFFVGLIVLLVASVLNIFFQSVVVGLFLSAIGVFVFSGLLVFDTWRIIRSGAYGQDDYVFAAVTIYLDLLNLFMFILSLLGGRRR